MANDIIWEKQNDSMFWEPIANGDTLEGELLRREMGTYGEQFIIKDKDGVEHRTKSWKVLSSRMSNINIGDLVKIIFVGMEEDPKKGKNPACLFEVYKAKKEPQIDAAP